MSSIDWEQYEQIAKHVETYKQIDLKIRDLLNQLLEQQSLAVQVLEQIPDGILDHFETRPELEPESETESESEPETEIEPETPASNNDILAFRRTLNLADSSLTRITRTLQKFHRACNIYYQNSEYTWFDVCDNITDIICSSLDKNNITVNDLSGNGVYIRNFLLQYDNCDEIQLEIHRLIGVCKNAIKSNTICRPLPENYVSFNDMQDKIQELMQDDIDHADNVLLLSLFSHENLGVFRPGEYINCRIGEPELPMLEPTNWLDLANGKYHRFCSKTYKSCTEAKRIVFLPDDVLEMVALKDRIQGHRLFPDSWTIETIRTRLQSLFPGKFITAQFLRALHVSLVAMKLSNEYREQRHLDMDHSAATAAAVYARFDLPI